jgi:DNA-binding XRE family transcriptional regulator
MANKLAAARRKLGMNRAEMAKRLATPYRTYVDWERGERRVPGVCRVAMELLLKQDQILMQRISARPSDREMD